MYYGNVSDFFYKTKNWLSKQPKFTINKMDKQNIVKIGGKYYKLDNVTGALEIINDNETILKTRNNNSRKKKILPEITNSNNNTDFSIPNKSNSRINTLNAPPIISIFQDNDNEDNEIDKKFIKNRNNKLNNKLGKTCESFNPFYSNLIRNNNKKKYLNTSNNDLTENSKSMEKIKKPFKLILQQKKNYYNSTKKKFHKNSENNKKFSKKSKKKIISPRKEHNKKSKQDFLNNLTEDELIGRIFPNEESLKVNINDNHLMVKIKDKLYQERLFFNLRNKFNFYEEKNSKENNINIPQLKVKNIMNLCKFGYARNKEPVHRKMYFDYVKKQKKIDNELFGLDNSSDKEIDIDC